MGNDVIQRHRDIYSIAQWGEGYYDIDANGHVIVYPTRNKADGSVDLYQLATEASKHNLNLPVLFRFGDILRDRVETLCTAFKRAIEFYEVLSSFRFVSSTPTLFNSGTLSPRVRAAHFADGDDWHANDAETALMMAHAPELVRPERARKAEVKLANAIEVRETSGLYFKEHVRRELVERFGWQRVYQGGLRGEDAALASAGTGLPFDIRVVEPMGSHLLLTGSIDGQPARIVAPPTATVRAGERVGLSVDPARLTWIDPATGRAIGRA